ncbi:phosphotransferase [Herbiconiux sp. L3-i23]|uniref:maltokinase N-terminal cap-like domain-containing protein n=1 Tax=Herbiconiux sp. L3-i23 TaxID=2905871 RepID=UPI0020580831|nr:phosphotransferase [Herbiconiux sp. L3-i23]BDI22115.1 trehalose biosynthesis protein [Herbiconiux sp. L3-i23]
MPLSLETLAEWMSAQRWFPGATAPPLRLVASYELPVSDPAVSGEVLLVLDERDGAEYQVPLAHRSEPVSGKTPIAFENGRFSYDGTRDQATAAAIHSLAVTGGSVSGDGILVSGSPFASASDRVASSRVLSGEQSNTSIIFETLDAGGLASTPVIVKVFRILHPGDNPDVVLQSAIAAAGSDRVPRSFGAIVGEWSGARGHLAFAQEFLPGTQDAWRVALDAVESDTDFSERAAALGAATAEVHAILARTLPTEPPSEERIDALREGFRARAWAAFVAVPELERLAPAVEEIYARAAHEAWPALQRIHGDFHLGQVLDVPDRGWVLLDFEGEPLRPMAERSEPDLALRDVAGMLRSFDYAAGSRALADPSSAEPAAQWAARACVAFLEGYAGGGADPVGLHPTLLTALELDKALYEVLYEARNRPTWLPIPRAAVERLVANAS